MRRSSIPRVFAAAGAATALAAGGLLLAAAPAHAADFTVTDEDGLAAAIAFANANPSQTANVTIASNIPIVVGLPRLTAGELIIDGAGYMIAANGVPTSSTTSAGIIVDGPAALEIDDLNFAFVGSGPAVIALGTPGDPAQSPIVALNDLDVTTSGGEIAIGVHDAAFAMTTTTIHDSGIGVDADVSFGVMTLSDVTIANVDDCGIDVLLSGDSSLVADGLNVSGAGCSALGVAVADDASATISDSTFADSVGGVMLHNASTGTIDLSDSTISGSSGDAQLTVLALSGATRLTNTTISGGSMPAGQPAVFALLFDGDVVLAHSTVTDNVVDFAPVIAAGGCGCTSLGGLVLDHTIVAGNTGTGAGVPDLAIDPDSAAASAVTRSLVGVVDPGDTATLGLVEDPAAHNLFDPSTPIDPDLGPLAPNGGATLTHLPTETSPVVNAGDPDTAGLPPTDQRGADRVSGGIVDIGSVEVQFASALALSVQSAPTGGQVVATGSGFPPNTTFTLTLHSDPIVLGSVTSSASGAFSFAFAVPSSVSAGAHTVVATLAGNLVGWADLTVDGLPSTGSDAAGPLVAAGALLLLGAALVGIRRRRA